MTKEEIYLFHAEPVLHSAIDAALETLVNDRSVFLLDEFYAVQNDISLAQRRRKGNLLAVEQMKRARKVARLLSKFPFTKGIAVSGSLSKNFADEETDIDFFIVTDANRLWIARTFMHLYKKFTFLTGHQHWFCMNYYVDEARLEITEKNIFTAMEITTLIPMQGRKSLNDFMAGNAWIKEYFPVNNPVKTSVPEINKGFTRKVVEKIFRGSLGNTVDKWLMGITDRRWQKKTETHQLNSKGGGMGMVVDRHYSKPDPKNFQNKVVEQYAAKVHQLLQLHNKMVSLAQ
ncbi:MAG: nucleotidyltransferase domain-containing protein [Ferruginibacter sp.]